MTGVEALGWVEDHEKVEQLGEAEVLCAPSLAAESFGIVLAEGMAAGVPVVASDLPGYRAVLRDGEAGRLSPPGDPVALADALYEMLQDEEERRRLAAAGLAAAAELSWACITDRIEEAYEDAVATPRVRGVHGLPGRPAFHRALLEYAVWAGRSGVLGSARRGPQRRRARLTATGSGRLCGRGSAPFCRTVAPVLDSAFAAQRPVARRPAVSVLSRGRSSAG